MGTDSDGDGVNDDSDLDDDNDRILDDVECPSTAQSTIFAQYTNVNGAMIGVPNGSSNVDTTVDISSEFSLPTGSIIVQ